LSSPSGSGSALPATAPGPRTRTTSSPTPADAQATLPGVLLDSNAYRGLSDAQFDTILEAETRHGVARYCEPFVVAEFLTHLADPADKGYASCRRAVVRTYRRCNVGAGGECGILRDPESRIAEFITGKKLERHDWYTEHVIAPLLGDAALVPAGQPLLAQMEPHLRAIAEHMAKVEAGFAETGRQVKATVATTLAGEKGEQRKETLRRAQRLHESPATRWGFAQTFIRQAYANAGMTLPDPLPDALVLGVRHGCAAAIEFEAIIWEKIVFQDAKPESPHILNLRWDQRIAYYIGWSMRGRPLWLVTDDNDFARAAAAAGLGDRVHTLAAYERWLGGT